MAIAKALSEGDVARAQIATVLLGVPDPPPLSKGASSRQQTIELVRDLHWSGMLKWDPAEHPRWPKHSDDGIGGRFAPKGITAAAEIEDERDPRFGIGGNRPPLEELIPQRLLQSPAGPVVQFLDNLLDLTGPADEANLALYTAQMRALLDAIHDVDPDYVYQSLSPTGGLAAMSWQGRRNVIFGLQADLAAAIYRVRGDIKPLQEVTLEFMQRATNAAYDAAVKLDNSGKLNIRLSQQEAIGNYVDNYVRTRLRAFFSGLRISMGPESSIGVNRREYNTSDEPIAYRVPDARVGNFAFDTSLTAKTLSDAQIKGFFNADFAPKGVVIVRPNQLGGNSSYVIWRPIGG